MKKKKIKKGRAGDKANIIKKELVSHSPRLFSPPLAVIGL